MSLASDDNDIMSYISSVSGMDDLPPLPIGMLGPPPISSYPITGIAQAQKYAPHSFANEQTHVACGNIYGEQHHPFGTGNQQQQAMQQQQHPPSLEYLLNELPTLSPQHFPAEPATPEASKVQKLLGKEKYRNPVHAVELANELAMVIIGRSVMLRSGLGAGTGEISGKLLALDETKIEEIHDIIKRQFRGKSKTSAKKLG